MYKKTLRDLKSGTKLFVCGKNKSVTLFKKTRFRVILAGSKDFKKGDIIHLVYYSKHVIFTWKEKILNTKDGRIVIKGNENIYSRINNRQSPRVEVENVNIKIWNKNKDKLLGEGKIVNVSELGLKLESDFKLECGEIYKFEFKLDINRVVDAVVVYKLYPNFYGIEFLGRLYQLENFIREVHIAKIRERRANKIETR